jgi:hypothetical protein
MCGRFATMRVYLREQQRAAHIRQNTARQTALQQGEEA